MSPSKTFWNIFNTNHTLPDATDDTYKEVVKSQSTRVMGEKGRKKERKTMTW